MNFQYTYEKKQDSDEIKNGMMDFAYNGFCELALDKRATSLKMVLTVMVQTNCLRKGLLSTVTPLSLA